MGPAPQTLSARVRGILVVVDGEFDEQQVGIGRQHRFGATVAEKRVLHIAGGDHGDQLCEVSTERIQAIQSELSLSDLGDRVFPHFIGSRLPPGLTGLLIAAVGIWLFVSRA